MPTHTVRRMHFPDRLAKYAAEVGPDACWLWPGRIRSDGYGKTRWQGRSVLMHRLAYELLVGPIPEGLTLDHLCRVRRCCNPAHLEPVTNGENVRRGESPSAKCARKTHCPRGHALEGANIRWDRKGGRECRTCRNARERMHYHQRRHRPSGAAIIAPSPPSGTPGDSSTGASAASPGGGPDGAPVAAPAA